MSGSGSSKASRAWQVEQSLGVPAAKQLEAAVLAWMEAAVARLEKDLDDERARQAR